ncbi:MAG: TlpA disulfide reductase family protein [Blastocatellia bacterium]|nr:TlpA disulfide reductase family protein [Blastocatellia bacterium]
MLTTGDPAPPFSLRTPDGEERSGIDGEYDRRLLIFFETDCPTCHLTFSYLEKLATIPGAADRMLAVSQDNAAMTREFLRGLRTPIPTVLDAELQVSQAYDPLAVPTLFLLDGAGRILQTMTAFDKTELNAIAAEICRSAGAVPFPLAGPHDGNPAAKPGCTSRHLEPRADDAAAAPALNLHRAIGARASRIELAEDLDAIEYCLEAGFDALPVVPPTAERVERMLRATPHAPDEVIARIPPNYGLATVEKIAANAVMAGCKPEMMRVLLPLIRAACDERFNLHGAQATTHFAAPLIVLNGPIRNELGFNCGRNLFSNVARANSTLGRAFQLALTNIGGAAPIDMSTLGNPGKFSFCIGENEETSPWEPFHVENGFSADQSAVTLFAAEPPRGVSEHNARTGRPILEAICRSLVTVFSYRLCMAFEAFVILCPEHVRTLHRDGFTKATVREFLFENTGVPLRAYESEDAEGAQYRAMYQTVSILGEPCYRKFASPTQIRIFVAGGGAGKFSAVLGSWATGPRGSQVVTYPVL